MTGTIPVPSGRSVKMSIKVNEESWNSLNDDDKKKVQSIIDGFFKGSQIVPDVSTDAPENLVIKREMSGFLKNPFCSATCGIAEAAAVAACVSAGAPPVVALCIAAAHEAANYCRSRC